MRAINHALTGALIGTLINEPEIAYPAAFLSHYICDAIPHYGSDLPEKKLLRSSAFKIQLYIDIALCLILVIVLSASKPHHWFNAIICAFLAALPDFFSMPRYLRAQKVGKTKKPNIYVRFASKIQWFEHPIGAVVEVAWFIALIVILSPYIINR